MRDINAGRDIKVDGDFVVNDNSQQYKLLIHCSNEELLAEEPSRRQQLKDERKAKLNKFLAFIAVAATLIFVSGVWQWFNGKMDAFALITGAAGFMVGLASLKVFERQTEFEQRQIAALNEINMLLRERGVRR